MGVACVSAPACAAKKAQQLYDGGPHCASAVVMGIGMCGAAFKAPALVEKGADLEGPTGTEMA